MNAWIAVSNLVTRFAMQIEYGEGIQSHQLEFPLGGAVLGRNVVLG